MQPTFIIEGLLVTKEQFGTYIRAKQAIKNLRGDDKSYAEHDLAGYINGIRATHMNNMGALRAKATTE
jgi:DNA-binding transcriptional regulator YhcF (GntR family)